VLTYNQLIHIFTNSKVVILKICYQLNFTQYYHFKTIALTLCRSNLKHYCMGRKAAFFSVGI